MEWRLDVGYKEPEECGFCEYFKPYNENSETGTCRRNPPKDATEEWFAWNRHCHRRGTCRYFRGRKNESVVS